MPDQKPTIDRPTIWEQFQERGLDTPNANLDDICVFIIELNTFILKAIGLNDGDYTMRVIAETCIFYVRFSAIFGRSKKLKNRLMSVWPNGPMSFRRAAGALGQDSWVPVPKPLAKRVLTLTDYIMGTKGSCQLTILAKSHVKQFSVPKKISNFEKPCIEFVVMNAILDIARNHDGTILFCHREYAKEDYIQEGFVCQGEDFCTIPEATLRAQHKGMSASSGGTGPSLVFRAAPIFSPAQYI